LSQELEPFGISGDELVGLTSRARDFFALFDPVDSPPPLRGPSARCLFSPVRRGVLRVLVLLRFDLVLFKVFVAAGLRTVRASVADGPKPARDGPPSLRGRSVFLGSVLVVLLALTDGPWLLAGRSAWPLRTVRGT
jgi:hypothetical protein